MTYAKKLLENKRSKCSNFHKHRLHSTSHLSLFYLVFNRSHFTQVCSLSSHHFGQKIFWIFCKTDARKVVVDVKMFVIQEPPHCFKHFSEWNAPHFLLLSAVLISNIICQSLFCLTVALDHKKGAKFISHLKQDSFSLNISEMDRHFFVSHKINLG